ncbi:HlyD family secretion protein [Paracraurococcus lichenis]|uniref:HlyD family secretion protein n=1 Tax=Paracraurococcus lichenis TaxID=3064888 RepID=A0ABT9DZP3_9PROT|nr:HlyD family secretion protein [Paracraurococcus sp. LOR1-02]MDO9709376.1 HlyD family secretion protein [Paracraurococcus sp. LOR1-02]
MDDAQTAEQQKPAAKGSADGDDRARQNEGPKEKHAKQPAAPSPGRRRLLIGAGVLAAVLVLAGGGWYWWQARQWESTDDAFLESHVTRLAPQVSGRVAQLLVDDNQRVEAGQLLVQINPRDYEVSLENARARRGSAAAQLAEAAAQVAVRRAAIDQAKANQVVAEADLENAETTLRRFRSVDPRAVTRQQTDDAEATSRSSRARVDAARQEVAGAEAQAAAAEAQRRAAEAALHEAEAAVSNAELQLSYTRIAAPVAGRVANRGVEVGNYVTPGQALLSVVEPTVWVTANFKETQLREIRPGQPVRVKVDAYPDPVLKGRVDSLQRGTGARFSVLPAQNATGNYVKITQRVPVKIVIEDDRAKDMPLSPGLSVVPSVRVREE